MRPHVDQLAAAGYPVRVVDVDREKELANRFGVTSLPCFVMVVNGREVARQVGAAHPSRLQQMLALARPAAAPPTNAQPPRESQPPRVLGQSPDNMTARNAPGAFTPPGELAPPRNTMAKNAAPADPAQASGGGADGRLLEGSVRLVVVDQGGQSYGTGTIIDTRGPDVLVLTCGHIFRNGGKNAQVTVHMNIGGRPVQAAGEVISFDDKLEIGLVSCQPGVQVTPIRVAGPGTGVAVNDRIVSVGCNSGQAPTALHSRVTALDKYLGPANIEVAGAPVEGRSGGGLFNESGHLIGICYAADPTDNEGVYVGLHSIHSELKRLNLIQVCAKADAPAAAPAAQMDELAPPNMPSSMPSPLVLGPTKGGPPSANSTGSADAIGNLSATERAALAEIGARGQDAEVICIIRPLNNPDAKSEIIVLDHASPPFLQQLTKAARPDPQLTSLDVPNRTARRQPSPQEQRDAEGWRYKR
jgi:S1-C subfamily serine protease